MRISVLVAVVSVLFAGCTTYKATSQSMSVQEARRVVADTLTDRNTYVFLGAMQPHSKVYEVRFRRDAFAIAVQEAAIDWSLFNDVKYESPSMKVCPLAEVSTSMERYPGNSNQFVCRSYQVEACGWSIGFCEEAPAKRFADAMYTLKANAR